MTKHIQTFNSSETAMRFSVRQLLRSSLVAGFVAGFVSSASAQSGLTLPSFPVDAAALTLPVSQDASFPITFAPQTQSHPSVTERIGTLLGLKNRTSTLALPQSNPVLTLPPFPSTESSWAATHRGPVQKAPQKAELNPHAPIISCSTSGKSEWTTELSGDPIALVSAEESLSEATKSSNVVQTALALDTAATESHSDSLTKSLSESLIDIEISKGPGRPTEEVKQRQPELVKRPPAMQLHIGGGLGNASTSAESDHQAATTRFSLSDASDSQTPQSSSQRPIANTMNVKIEGEPLVAQAIARPSASPESLVTRQKTIFATQSLSGGHKTLSDRTQSDKAVDRSTTMGERLEVGLHESTNVETTQPISGLSVEHPELCQVIKSGERSVSFVGLKAGQTRVALFTTNASGERKIEIREVVIAGAENRQADMKSLATEISRSVHRMYPNSHIEVIAEADGLTVQGYAGTEEEAKKIIGLVRRTSLQPVVDRLATYK